MTPHFLSLCSHWMPQPVWVRPLHPYPFHIWLPPPRVSWSRRSVVPYRGSGLAQHVWGLMKAVKSEISVYDRGMIDCWLTSNFLDETLKKYWVAKIAHFQLSGWAFEILHPCKLQHRYHVICGQLWCGCFMKAFKTQVKPKSFSSNESSHKYLQKMLFLKYWMTPTWKFAPPPEKWNFRNFQLRALFKM